MLCDRERIIFSSSHFRIPNILLTKIHPSALSHNLCGPGVLQTMDTSREKLFMVLSHESPMRTLYEAFKLPQKRILKTYLMNGGPALGNCHTLILTWHTKRTSGETYACPTTLGACLSTRSVTTARTSTEIKCECNYLPCVSSVVRGTRCKRRRPFLKLNSWPCASQRGM